MVKDILREMKRKWFQFVAIGLIIALGVGFLVGIQVTGYDMRQTGDAYILDANIMDLQIINTLGIDQEMVNEIVNLIDGDVSPVVSYDAFVKTAHLDGVIHFFEYDKNTADDLTLISGRLPEKDSEVVVDHQLFLQEKVFLNDEIKIIENDHVHATQVKVVGFVDSSLYFNLERGQSRLGSGSLSGFMYLKGSPMKESIFTGLRIVSDDVEGSKSIIKTNEKSLVDNRFDRLIAPEILKLEDAQKELDQGRLDADREFVSQWQTIMRSENQLKDQKEEVSLGISEIASKSFEGTLAEQLASARKYSNEFFDISLQELESKRELIMLIPNEIERNQALLELEGGIAKIAAGRKETSAAYNLLESAIHQIAEAEVLLANGKSSFYAEKAKIEKEFDDNQVKIDDGYKEIADTSHGSLFILNRSESVIGFDDFYQDSERIEQIGKVFPLIFFGVAILVTLSTVTRMVDESRMQIGIYKALGYSWFRTSLKYVGFTFFAWLLGSIVGLLIGFVFVPELIYQAYQIMYLTPELVGGFVWSYAWLPLVISFFSSVGVALFKSQAVARETASLLLVPPVPKGGQRILLERFGFIWSRLNFLYKVSLRNLFRNKTRFLMTVVGIGGCCGLLLTGFGLRHSIYSIVDKQFDDVINYDGVVAYQKEWEPTTELFVDSASVHTDNGTVGSLDVSIYAAEDLNDLSRLIIMNDYESKKPIEIDQNSVIISQKLASYNDLARGDEISVKVDNKFYSFTIDQIVENYIGHYIYLNKDNYDSIVGSSTDLNLSLFQYAGSGDFLSETLLKDDNVLSINLLGNLKTNYIKMMGNFDIVIVVIAGAAFALELIVLLNLITMNISERSKELATLKVLGFYPKELSSYIMRENVILTLISLVVGVVFGTYLHNFVVVSAEINLVMFNREILLSSYLIAVILTFGLSVIINLMMSKRANRVNMAEALKI